MFNKKLRIPIYFVFSVLVLTFCFSWIFYGASPPDIMKYLLAQVGSGVGMSVSVPENPFNTLAQQLKEKETELEKREESIMATLEKRERDSRIIYNLILGLMTVLFSLLLLNFYFDYQNRKYKNDSLQRY